MSPEKEKFLLKILSGPHKDAEVPISQDGLLLGRGENCDVVLADTTLEKEHVRLAVEKDNDLRLIPLGKAPFYINGNPYTEPTLLHLFQYVLVGKTLFSVGPSDEPWPYLSEQDAPPIVEDKPKAAETSTDALTPDKKTDVNGNTEEAPVSAVTEKPKEGDNSLKNVSTTKTTPKRKTWRYALCIFIFLSIIGVVSGGGYYYYIHKKRLQEAANLPPPIPATEVIYEGLTKLGLNKNFFDIKELKGNLSVQAYVATNNLMIEVRQYLKGLTHLPIRSIRIYSQESLIVSAQEVFKNLGYALTVDPLPDPDGLLIKGYLLDITQLNVVKNRLFSDLPSLRKVETNVLSAGDANDMAYNLLEKYQLAGLIKVVPFERGLILSGNIEERDETTWKQAHKDLRKTFEHLCRLVTRVVVVPARVLKQTFFESPIESIHISEETNTAWLDLQNGQRYFESSVLPSGYLIQKISPEGILLSKNGEVINFKTEEI